MDKVRFGIVGCGNMGTGHAKNLLDGKIKIRLGNTDRLADKLSLAATVLAKQTEPSGPALLDASDPAAVTYREAPDITLPDWAGSR